MGEVMKALDNAMQLMLQQKRNELWKLSARMDNAMIETFQRKGFEPNEYMDIDKYSGFGNMRLRPGVEDELSWENQVKEAKDNCLHLRTTVYEYVEIRMAESKEEKKNRPPEVEQLSFAAEYWKRNYYTLAEEHHELSKAHRALNSNELRD